jgi:hypothetical protein
MLKIALQLIERHRSKEGPTVDVDKLNLVDILLAQQGDDKLPDHAMAAILFVSALCATHYLPYLHKAASVKIHHKNYQLIYGGLQKITIKNKIS